MEQEKKKKTGHCIVTYRVRLYDRHYDWLQLTKQLYTKVVAHFFHVLIKEEELLQQSDFLLLRALEEKCIGTKEMKQKGIAVPYPLVDFPKIPLYFRRSAINGAIALRRKLALNDTSQEFFNETKTLEELCFTCPFTLYKGMYQNFTDTTIDIKVFTGEAWKWVTYPFTGRSFPKEATKLSPFLVFRKKQAWLNVPLSFEVDDIRTVKERMEVEEKICAVSFPDYNVMAAAVVLSKAGEVLSKKLFQGGKQREHQRKRILEQIKQSEKSRGLKKKKEILDIQKNIEEPNGTKENIEQFHNKEGKHVTSDFIENATLYQKLKDINQHYAQTISRQILNYCIEQNIKVIVVPNYEKPINFNTKHFLNTDSYRWLGRSIIKNLKYKAFQQGIVVTSIRPSHITDTCSECGSKIKRYNEGHKAGQSYLGGKLFLCPNGHKGNTAYNTAKNIGKSFWTYWT